MSLLYKDSAVLDLNAEEFLVGEEDDDDEPLREYRELLQARASSKQRASVSVSGARQHPVQAEPAAGSSSSASGTGAPSRPRAFIAVEATGYSQEQAQQWAPEGCRITKDDQTREPMDCEG